MDDSEIAWTDDTVNGWWGCSKVSPACAHCYAEGTSARFGHDVWGPSAGRMLRVEAAVRDLERIARRSDKEGRPRRVFLHSMSDIFEDRADLVEPRKVVFGALERIGRRIQPLVLTKRTDVMLHHAKTVGWLPWVLAGCTVENQTTAESRLPDLLAVDAMRFVSMEPLLGFVDLDEWLHPGHETGGPGGWFSEATGIHWIIVGGESGPAARPMHPSWVRGLRDQCASAEVPFFCKQWGEWAPISALDVDDKAVDAMLYRSNRVAEPGEDQGFLDESYGRTCRVPQLVLRSDGVHRDLLDPLAFNGDVPGWPAYQAFRIGKKAAGRLLDGVLHDALPAFPAWEMGQ